MKPPRLQAIVFALAGIFGALPAAAAVGADRFFVSGHIQSPDRELTLTTAQLGFVSDWLRRHPDWRMNLATPPPSSFKVLLDTGQGTATELELWSAEHYPGWRNAILIHRFDGRIGVQTFSSTEDRATFLKVLGLAR